MLQSIFSAWTITRLKVQDRFFPQEYISLLWNIFSIVLYSFRKHHSCFVRIHTELSVVSN